MIEEQVSRGNRATYTAKTRKATGDRYLQWRRDLATDDACTFYQLLMDMVHDARMTRDVPECMDDAFQSLTAAINRHCRDYDHRMLRSAISFFEAHADMLVFSTNPDIDHEGMWQYEIRDCFWNIMSWSARNNDLYIFTRASRIFMRMIRGAPGAAKSSEQALFEARLFLDVVRYCKNSKSYFLMDMFLEEVQTNGVVPGGLDGPARDLWAAEVPEMLFGVLAGTIRDDDTEALGWVLAPLLGICAASGGLPDAWTRIVPRTIEYCAERGRVSLLDIVVGRLLDSESEGTLPTSPGWVSAVTESLRVAIRGGVYSLPANMDGRYAKMASVRAPGGSIHQSLIH